MNTKHLFRLGLCALSLCMLTVACEKDNPQDEPTPAGVESYFFSATNSEGTANYIATVPSLTEGQSTVVGNGLETTTGTYWFVHKDKLFRLQYNQGNAGGTSSYFLNAQGQIEQSDATYDIQRFETYGFFGDYVITAAAAATTTLDAEGNAAYGINITYLDPINQTTTNRSQPIICENFLGNGEYVTFSGIIESGGKLYTAVIPVGVSPFGIAAGHVSEANKDLITKNAKSGVMQVNATQYPNECWIAMFDNEQMDKPTLIKTDKQSYSCGRMRSQYYQCTWAASNGDIYVFAPNVSRTQADARQRSDYKSTVMRIKAGDTKFDDSFGIVDIETACGHALFRCWHMTDNYFLLQLFTGEFNGMGQNATAMGVFNGATKEVKIVTGLPAAEAITNFSSRPYNDANGKSYISVQTNDGQKPAVYEIDPATATAKRGLEVECGSISYAGKLTAK